MTMKGNYNILWVAVLILLPFTSESQSFKEDIKVMYNSYLKATDFYAKVDVKMYEHSKDATPYVQRKAIIRKSGTNFLYELDKNKMLMNDKCAVIVDDNNKTIVYKKGKQAQSQVTDVVVPDFDSLITTYDKVIYKGVQGNSKVYTIILKDANIKQVDIYLEQEKKWLTKLVYHYNETLYKVDSKVIITFSDITDNPKFSSTQFSEKQFVVKENGKNKVHQSYASYRLIEMTEDF